MIGRLALLVCGTALLAGCGSFFESTLPSPQAYVLRLPPRSAPAEVPAAPGSLKVQRPEPGPGLASENIALLRSGQRFDFYAAARWAAPAPDLIEGVLVEQLRGAGLFSAVFDDASPYSPAYDLRCTLLRFEADYTGGGNAPVVNVSLDCTLGRHRDRALLGSFVSRGVSAASDDRLGRIVTAFETATAAAIAELEQHIATALASQAG